MPPIFLWTIGALSAAALAKLAMSEARRVNDELDAARRPQAAPEAAALPRLKRDPRTGIYRPG